ncbi:MAG: hypothetical protein U7M05_02695 [Candidatus Igneacidithiobacillus chanchocoensis]
MEELQSAVLLRQWRMAAPAEQDRSWADADLRRALASAVVNEGLSLSWGQVDLHSSRCWLAQLNTVTAAASLPGRLAAQLLQAPLASEREAVPLQTWSQIRADAPLPIDMEVDILAEAIEQRDSDRLLPLLRSMAEDSKARQIVIDRLRLRVAEDGYAHGLRSSLFHAWAQLVDYLPSSDFTPLTMLVLTQHWKLPEACAVVVPEGRVERRAETGKALLQSLRERDLRAYMEHLRGMGDQPLAALRQLLLALGLMIIEYPRGESLVALGEIYLWLAAVLQMSHRSLRRSRRILFSVAADLFRFAGWTAQRDWPGYTEMAAFRHTLSESTQPQTYNEDWQRVLQVQALGSEALVDWYQQRAARQLLQAPVPDTRFWAHWQETQAAIQALAGPLLWIHPLVFLRLYPE